MDSYYVINPFLHYWMPYIVTIVFALVMTLLALKRQKIVIRTFNQNAEAVRQNTEAVKTLIEELRRSRS